MIASGINWAFRRGFRKGVAGGSGGWLVVAVAAGAVKLLRRTSRDRGESITLDLKPGERYTIVCADEPPSSR